MEKLIIAATDEIFETIEETFNGNYGVGNYWINKNYNIFTETGVDLDDNNEIERRYYILKLEQYDNDEEILDVEYDYEESENMGYDSLYKAVEMLINNNKEIV